MKERLETEGAPKPIGPYSQGIKTESLVFCAGQLGIDPRTGTLAEGVVAQTAQALENLKAVLRAARLDAKDVVKTTVFMADLAEYPQMNEEYAKHFSPPYPSRSTVQASLPRAARVEIDAIAVKTS